MSNVTDYEELSGELTIQDVVVQVKYMSSGERSILVIGDNRQLLLQGSLEEVKGIVGGLVLEKQLPFVLNNRVCALLFVRGSVRINISNRAVYKFDTLDGALEFLVAMSKSEITEEELQ